MKNLLRTLAFATLCAVPLAHGENADVADIAKKSGVSSSCAQRILVQTTRVCNAESKSKAGSDLEHPCFYNYDMTAMRQGILEIVFTTGDSQEWSYSVFAKDAGDVRSCSFRIKSQN
jgi:hypothetical protein